MWTRRDESAFPKDFGSGTWNKWFFCEMKLEYLDFYAFLSLNLQLIAVTIKNLILFDIGLNVAFAGIIIPTLTGAYRNEHNQNETLLLTEVQSSWLGKASSHQISNWKTFFDTFSSKFQAVWHMCWNRSAVLFLHLWQVLTFLISTP